MPLRLRELRRRRPPGLLLLAAGIVLPVPARRAKGPSMKPTPKLDAIVKRPVKHLAAYAVYRHLWRDHDRLRAEHKSRAPWPQWCYAPLSVSRACFELPEYGGWPVSSGEEEGSLVGVSALAAWRTTKGIYLFDATVFEELWHTDIQGALPVELLQRLPEWSVYVPFPVVRKQLWGVGPTAGEIKCHGFFGHMDCDQHGAPFLHLSLDTDYSGDPPFALSPITLKLTGNLSDSCAPFHRQVDGALSAVEQLVQREAPNVTLSALRSDVSAWACRQESDLIRPLVSILLWLCSANPEIAGLDPLRGLRTKRTKKGLRNFGPDEPRVYEVAYRIGAALRLDRAAIARGIPGDGSHASPRPHIRRAHWHAFWTGPKASISKDRPADRKLVLKWIAPIAVCVGTDDPIIPTVHPVLPPDREGGCAAA